MSFESDSDENGLQLLNGKSQERTKQRTEIAKKQKQLLDELVDMRVKMQSLLVLMNKLPQVASLCFLSFIGKAAQRIREPK